jgi:diguanylate cyclase (GGDEF)-like protein
MQKIAILYDASQAVLSTFDLDEVLTQMLNILRDYFHLRSGAILLLDKEAQALTVRAGFNLARPLPELATVPIAEGITGTAARTKRPIYSPDVRRDPRYISGDEETRSEVAVPLIVNDRVVGVLDCQSDEMSAFDDEMVDLLTLFATNAAIALRNAELYAREQRRSAQLEAINTIARQTTAVRELPELLETLCSLIPRSFPVDHLAMFLLDSDNRLVLRRVDGTLPCHLQQNDPLPEQAKAVSKALETGQPTLNADRQETTLCDESQSEILLPLISFGQKLGVLICSSRTPAAFQQSDLQSLESMADIVAKAIQNASYMEKLRAVANLDGLTGVFNRRYFETKFPEKLAEASRYGGGLSVLIVDIDNFKSVNDEFGHVLGDEVLKKVSALLKQKLRKIDLLCRYGGEELIIVAPATTGTNAQELGEKLRKTIEEFPFPGIPRPVTISIGVSEFPIHGSTRDELVRSADEALYRAKAEGRNRVATAELSPTLTA